MYVIRVSTILTRVLYMYVTTRTPYFLVQLGGVEPEAEGKRCPCSSAPVPHGVAGSSSLSVSSLSIHGAIIVLFIEDLASDTHLFLSRFLGKLRP